MNENATIPLNEVKAPCTGGCGKELVLDFDDKPQLCYDCQLFLHTWSNAKVFCEVLCTRIFHIKYSEAKKEYRETLPKDAIIIDDTLPYWYDNVPRHLPACTVGSPGNPWEKL